MSLDITVLRIMAEQSGRVTYITDSDYHVIWTNSDVSLASLLRNVNRYENMKFDRVRYLSCNDGTSVKITPVMNNGDLEVMVIEKYSAYEILQMFAKTGALKSFSEHQIKIRNDMIGYLREIGFDTPELNKLIDSISIDSANMTAFLTLMSHDSPSGVSNICDIITPLADALYLLCSERKEFVFSYEHADKIFCYIDAMPLKTAVAVMFTNACVHCSSVEKHITLSIYRDGSENVIEVCDNGTNADIEDINACRTSFFIHDDSNTAKLGISYLQLVADKYDGTLTFENTKSGGLCARLSFAAANISDYLVLHSPSEMDMSDDITADILKEVFDSESILGTGAFSIIDCVNI